MIRAVVLRRGRVEESRHRVHVAVVDARGRVLHSAGDAERTTFLRSAAKPFQALPLVAECLVGGPGGMTLAELAVCCGSHNGEPLHLQAVRRILDRTGLPEEALECGPHSPLGAEAADRLRRSGEAPAPIHNNCSGKHAGMLALARARRWEPAGYRSPRHPVQRRMREEVALWTGIPAGKIVSGVDGCGVPCFGVPLRAMARGYAALVEAEADGVPGPGTVVQAMSQHPFMVAGTGRLCTELMELAGDRVVAKVGAEGVYGAALRGRGVGIALKVEDGARRACGVALVGVLEAVEVLTGEELARLGAWRRRPVPNTRGEEVAWLEAEGDGWGGAPHGGGRR
jgi:L-asparaginase II